MDSFLSFLGKSPFNMVLLGVVVASGTMLIWPLVSRLIRRTSEVGTFEAVQLINRRDAVGRLAMFITLMRQHVPRETEGDLDVPLPMSRSDIANYLGLSLESVSRAAAELQRRGIVKFEGRNLARIVDPARLERLSAAV